MKTEEIIANLTSGDKQRIKKTIWQIERVRKGNRSRYPEEYKGLVSWAVDCFDGIRDSSVKVASLKALQLPFMYLGSRDYPAISDFILKVLQNGDGRVREQAYNTTMWFLTDITPDRERRGATEKKIEKTTKQFIDFVLKVDKAAKRHIDEAKGKPYLNGMKPCVYKSLQRVLCRVLRNEWLLKHVHKAGYKESPSHTEIFGNNSKYWDLTPLNLELHEMEFAMHILKKKRVNKIPETLYEFKVIMLKEGNIYRNIRLNPRLSLYSLAEAIVYAFDFDFDHCFGFYSDFTNGRVYDSKKQYELFYDLPDVESSPKAKSVKTTKIQDVWKKVGEKMYFVFDYGDGWMFEVVCVATDTKAKIGNRRFFWIGESHGKAPEQYPPCEE